jgi:hypothetical protein
VLPISSCPREPWRLVCRLLMMCSWSAGMRGICIFRSYCYVATFYYIPYLLKCKMRVFPEIWRLNMSDHLKFSHDVLNPTMPSQTKACIVEKSCETCTLVEYYTAQRSNLTPTFRDNLWAPNSKVKKFK